MLSIYLVISDKFTNSILIVFLIFKYTLGKNLNTIQRGKAKMAILFIIFNESTFLIIICKTPDKSKIAPP